MISILIGKPKKFNPENVDYFQYNNDMLKEKIEGMVKETMNNIDWSVKFSCRNFEPELVHDNIFVNNPECKATFKLIYKLNNGESFHIDIVEHGDTYTYNIQVKNRRLIEYKLVENNKLNTYPECYTELDKFKEAYDVMKGLLI